MFLFPMSQSHDTIKKRVRSVSTMVLDPTPTRQNQIVLGDTCRVDKMLTRK